MAFDVFSVLFVDVVHEDCDVDVVDRFVSNLRIFVFSHLVQFLLERNHSEIMGKVVNRNGII